MRFGCRGSILIAAEKLNVFHQKSIFFPHRFLSLFFLECSVFCMFLFVNFGFLFHVFSFVSGVLCRTRFYIVLFIDLSWIFDGLSGSRTLIWCKPSSYNCDLRKITLLEKNRLFINFLDFKHHFGCLLLSFSLLLRLRFLDRFLEGVFSRCFRIFGPKWSQMAPKSKGPRSSLFRIGNRPWRPKRSESLFWATLGLHFLDLWCIFSSFLDSPWFLVFFIKHFRQFFKMENRSIRHPIPQGTRRLFLALHRQQEIKLSAARSGYIAAGNLDRPQDAQGPIFHWCSWLFDLHFSCFFATRRGVIICMKPQLILRFSPMLASIFTSIVHQIFVFFLEPFLDRLLGDFMLIFGQKLWFWSPLATQGPPKIYPRGDIFGKKIRSGPEARRRPERVGFVRTLSALRYTRLKIGPSLDVFSPKGCFLLWYCLFSGSRNVAKRSGPDDHFSIIFPHFFDHFSFWIICLIIFWSFSIFPTRFRSDFPIDLFIFFILLKTPTTRKHRK